MSLTLETFEYCDLVVEYEWDKYAPHFIVLVGKKYNGVVNLIWIKRYATPEQAKRSYNRQVLKVKKGDYQ
jgi:hypothetical protein